MKWATGGKGGFWIDGKGVAAQKRRSYIAQEKGSKKAAATRANHWNRLSVFYATRYTSSHETLIMAKAHCCLPLTVPPEDFKVKAHINHRAVQQHSPQIPTVRKLETQLWLWSLVRFIKIYETANMNLWCLGVLSTLGLPD